MAIPQPPVLDPLPVPDPPGLLGGWGRKLEITLLRFVLNTLNTVMSPFWHWRDIAIKNLSQSIEDELKPVITPVLDVIEDNPNIPQWLRNMTQHLRFSEPITFVVLAGGVILSAITGVILGLAEPIKRLMSQEVDSHVHSARMTPGEAVAALRRGNITEAEYHNQLSDGGWSERLEDVWKMLLTQLFDTDDLAALIRRGAVPETLFVEEMVRKGYDGYRANKLKVLLDVIPPLTDIIRMAVREAFTPEVVQQFQLHAELPAEMVAWAKKQGLSEDWAKAYWASHWVLPPLGVGYEMLHRDVIDQAEMQMLIKAQDVSPFWRDKLIDISYRPYTRVDVRRMYGAGVLDRDGVYRSYRDIGYNDEKATKMTDFTVAVAGGAERDLTKAEVLYGYEHGFFNDAEVDALLLSLKYDQAEADYYKAKVNYKIWQALVKETVKYIGMQYIANQIDQVEVYAQLGALNLPAEQMNRYIHQWDLKKAAKTKRLTAERLVKFRTQDVIDDADFTSEMSGLGYSQRYINWFLQSMGIS